MRAPAASLITRKADFQHALLSWYRANARALPWREAPSLYKTVVSEFMLQQTQVKTVLPYFTRWLAEFPDFATLAAAPEARVLKLWEGLGYYARARTCTDWPRRSPRAQRHRAQRTSGESCPAWGPTPRQPS